MAQEKGMIQASEIKEIFMLFDKNSDGFNDVSSFDTGSFDSGSFDTGSFDTGSSS